MFRRMLSLMCCLFLTLSLTGCLTHHYVGKTISSSVPHNKYYADMPTKNSLCMPSSSGENVYFNYTLSGEGNTYTITGEMVPGFKAEDYPDIKLYLLLVNRGVIVDVVRLDTLHNGFAPEVKFDKTFTTDKTFRFVTFTYHFVYR